MSDTDLYAVLGVPKSADAEAIKKAFRASAMKFHPDRNPGDKSAEDSFKKVNHAYEVLSDPKKRASTTNLGEVGLREGFDADRFRQWQNAGAGGGGASYEDFFGQGAGGNVDFGDIFSQFFGGAGAVAARGCTSAETPPALAAADEGPRPGGRDHRRLRRRGAGPRGRAERERQQHPGEDLPGAQEGSRVRIAGKGVPSPAGGPPGDLLLTVHVTPHASYWLEDNDLHVRVPVTVIEAWKGAKVNVPTPSGEVTVKVPPAHEHRREAPAPGEGCSEVEAHGLDRPRRDRAARGDARGGGRDGGAGEGRGDEPPRGAGFLRDHQVDEALGLDGGDAGVVVAVPGQRADEGEVGDEALELGDVVDGGDVRRWGCR
ncbi:MAG: DnaJ domain-containing protein [Polyangiales bacterium]